ncbi:PAS domain-containing protein [Pelagibius sp. 7325]|uniref:PAS domain-containing protein n=1 Tax=Pelagibius sp. 7325 TaxID=3131994 RepID=UPI0030EC0247
MLRAQPLAQEDPETIFFSPISRDFCAYWWRLAQQRGGIPLRDDIDPARLLPLLPHIFIVEKIKDTGRFFFRLSGTGIREIMGSENTNHFLDELLHGEDLVTVSAMFDQVLGEGVGIRSIEGLTYSDRSYLRVEIVRLPLCKSNGDRRLILGCLSRIEDDNRPDFGGAPRGSAVKDRQVIHIANDVLPRKAF